MFGERFDLRGDTRAYPRYHFFRRQLVDLYPRVDRTLEKNQLTDVISQGKITWLGIQAEVQSCIDKSAPVSIYVIATKDSHIKEIKDDLFKDKTVFKERTKEDKLPIETVTSESNNWKSLSIDKFTSRYAPEIIVYIKGEDESAEKAGKQTVDLPEIQKDHLIIYDSANKTAELYRHLEKDGKQSKVLSLSENIEFLLEENVVGLLEQFAIFLEKFLPGKGDPDLYSFTIKSEVTTQLQESLKVQDVLKDFIPVDADEELLEIQKKKSKGPQVTMTDKEKKTAIFYLKIRSILARKAKCLYSDLMAKRLGIPGTILNEFLGENFFNFEEQFQDGLKDNMLPKLTLDSYELVRLFKKCALSYYCHKLCSDLLPNADTYVREKYTVLRTLKMIQFETFGLLKRSSRAVTMSIPRVRTIPKELQLELLELDYVVTCGTLYGVLTVVSSETITEPNKREIRDIIMDQHKYPFQWEIALTDGWKLQGPKEGWFFETGHAVVPSFKDGGRERFMKDKNDVNLSESDKIKGTLGCFVGDKTGNGLYAVTCNHCVDEKYFIERIEAETKDSPTRELGRRKYHLSEADVQTRDIALIEVDEDKKMMCEKALVRSDACCFNSSWTFSEKTTGDPNLDGCLVYKIGHITGLTKGVVAGSDFRTRNEYLLTEQKFSELHSIFVDVRRGERGEQSQTYPHFSDYGDSGSVICTEDIGEAGDLSHVEVISLLCGSISLTNPQTKTQFQYTYSSQLRQLLNELNAQYQGVDIKID